MTKMLRGWLAVGLGLGCCGWTTGARGQESPVPKPTAEHQRLAEDVGTWDATMKLWAQGPNSEPVGVEGRRDRQADAGRIVAAFGVPWKSR